jgi:hypothetical protein
MSGNLIGLGASRVAFDPLRVGITGEANTQLLKRMIGRIAIDADKIAEKYAMRMAAYARDLAPSSAASAAAGRDTHNPHDTTIKDSIYARRLSNARYVVGVDNSAWWAIFSLEGAKPHKIYASATGTKATARRASRQFHLTTRRLDILEAGNKRHSGLLPRYYKKTVRIGRKQYADVFEERKLSTREIMARAKRQAKYDAMQQEAEALNTLFLRSTDRANQGSANLIFPWSKGVSRWNGKLQIGLFVGPVVKSKGTKRNNFLLKARSRIGSPFAADLKRLLEGRYQ